MVGKASIILLCCLSWYTVNAQHHCFARVALDRRSVYVQQPFKVTITVLTTTWFTKPLNFENLQIPNAFIIPFDQTQPGMFTIGDTQYAGLQFYFIIFPYKPGKFSVPSLRIEATTPPEGSAVARKITIQTAVQSYTVKDIPAEMTKQNWLVAKNVSIHEHWNKPLSHLRVGDVIERTITIDARGTLPQFIPELKEKPLSFANTYPQDPELDDTRDQYQPNGKLTQTFIYLMEKEGAATFPPMKIHWWNPLTQKEYERSLQQHVVHIQPNANLGMITTLRDSLNAQQSTVATTKTKQPLLLYGMHWYWFLLSMLAALAGVWILVLLLMRFFKAMKLRAMRYRQSELYWFRKMEHARGKEFWNTLYGWWDRIPAPEKKASLTAAIAPADDGSLVTEVAMINRFVYSILHRPVILQKMKTELKHFRHWLTTRRQHDHTIADRQKAWDNFQ